MVRPAHTLVEFSGVFGSLATPIEEWSFGLRCAGVVAPADLGVIALAAETAYTQTVRGLMPADVVLTRTRVANVQGNDADDAAGRIERNADGSYQLADEPGALAGTGTGGASMPTHVAVAVSLVTARPGATGRGRIFLPMIADSLDGNRLLTAAAAGSVAGNVRDLVQTLNAIAFLGPVSVVSSKGYASAVTSIRCGRVPDTQRSRRHRREEGYVAAAFS